MWDAALEPIDEEQCLELLKRVEYGRVAVVTGEGRPEIFPVNYAVHGHTVVFITGSAVMQAWAPLGHVAFEADHIDPATHEGWDVVVTGEGADITDSRDPQALAAHAYAIKSAPRAQRPLDIDTEPAFQRAPALHPGPGRELLLADPAVPGAEATSVPSSTRKTSKTIDRRGGPVEKCDRPSVSRRRRVPFCTGRAGPGSAQPRWINKNGWGLAPPSRPVECPRRRFLSPRGDRPGSKRRRPRGPGAHDVDGGPVTTRTVIDLLARRVHCVPRLRQRFYELRGPLGPGRWVDDPDFDVERHVRHEQLGPDGDLGRLAAMAGNCTRKSSTGSGRSGTSRSWMAWPNSVVPCSFAGITPSSTG